MKMLQQNYSKRQNSTVKQISTPLKENIKSEKDVKDMFFVVFAMVHASLKTIMIEEMFKSYFFAQLWLKMNNSGCLLREYLHLGDDH